MDAESFRNSRAATGDGASLVLLQPASTRILNLSKQLLEQEVEGMEKGAYCSMFALFHF